MNQSYHDLFGKSSFNRVKNAGARSRFSLLKLSVKLSASEYDIVW